MASYGVPFPGGGGGHHQPTYVNPNAGYAPSPAGGFQMGMMPAAGAPNTAPAADPYANAQPGTIAYAKSEGPDGIATYTPVIAQETFYHTPAGPTRGIKWVTATSSQASAAGIPSGAITASNPAQLPQAAGMMPPMSAAPGSIAGGYGPPSMVGGYPPESPADDYPVMRPGQSQRDHEKAVKRWEKERRAADKRARKEEKERQKSGGRGQYERNPQDPYDIAGRKEAPRPRRGSTGDGLGFERARRMSGGASLRDDELSKKLESLDMSFNTRRERRMSGGGGGYAPSAGGYRSRKGSMSEADRNRKMSGSYDLPRPSFYPTAGGAPPGGGYPMPGGYGAGARSMPGSPVRPHSAFPHDDMVIPPLGRGGPSPGPRYNHSRHPSPSMGSSYLPGGYGGGGGGGGGGYGGGRDPNPSSYSYGAERTPYSTASAQLSSDNYALTTTRRPGGAGAGAGGNYASNVPVSGRELNRAQPFTAFEEFFLVEDLRELLQPQPPPLPAALVPHDVMAEEWDRCMQGLIQMTSQAVQSTRSSGLDPLADVLTQWNTAFFLPRGVDIGLYKGNSRRSGPSNINMPSNLRSYDESDSESESSSSSSTSSSSSEDDRYFSSARREQRAAKKAERKARHKEKARRRRARRRQRTVSIRVRAVPIN